MDDVSEVVAELGRIAEQQAKFKLEHKGRLDVVSYAPLVDWCKEREQRLDAVGEKLLRFANARHLEQFGRLREDLYRFEDVADDLEYFKEDLLPSTDAHPEIGDGATDRSWRGLTAVNERMMSYLASLDDRCANRVLEKWTFDDFACVPIIDASASQIKKTDCYQTLIDQRGRRRKSKNTTNAVDVEHLADERTASDKESREMRTMRHSSQAKRGAKY